MRMECQEGSTSEAFDALATVDPAGSEPTLLPYVMCTGISFTCNMYLIHVSFTHVIRSVVYVIG